MAAIEWDRLTQPQFDRIVEALMLKENADLHDDAFAVNGRGGDRGIDISIRRGGHLAIYQLKYFPEGFSGGFAKSRREQIKQSFDTGVKNKPDEWWLVVPNTVTTLERKFATGLTKTRKPKIQILDRPMLDHLAAAHPDIVDYFERDQLLHAAEAYNQERALLIDREDLIARVAALGQRGETLHPDWRLDFMKDGDIIGTKLVAKHRFAAERTPITLKLDAKFGAEQEALRQDFERLLTYGLSKEISLPPSVVSRFTVDGPEFIAHTSEQVELTFVPNTPETVGRPFAISFVADGGKVEASFLGETVWTGSATLGITVQARFFDSIQIEFLLPHDKTNPGRLNVELDFAGGDPSSVVRAVAVLEKLESSHAIALEFDGQSLARLAPSAPGRPLFGDERSEIAAHKEIAGDLEYVQRETSRYFAYPAEVDIVDRAYLRCLRLMLEGRCVVLPGLNQFTPKLNGNDGESARKLLSGESMSLIVEQEDFGLEVFGHQIYVGEARLYAPQVAAVDGQLALEALESGRAKGHELTIRCDDGYGIWAFVPSRYIAESDDRLRPISLGLAGVPDAPDIGRAQTPATNDIA